MALNLVGWLSQRTSRSPRPIALWRQARPTLDRLEDRVVPASTATLSLSLPLAVSNVELVESGGSADADITADITFSGREIGTLNATLSSTDGSTLNVDIDAVNLDLLGVEVETSDIGLAITTNNSALGRQLGQVAAELEGADASTNLGDVLDDLNYTDAQVNRLLNGVDRLLDRVLGTSLNVTGLFGEAIGDDSNAEEGDLINFTLGPADLNVMGLGISLDEAATIDVSVNPDADGPLGDLLSDLGDDINLDNVSAHRVIGEIDRLFDRLGGILSRVDDLENLDNRTVARLQQAVDQFQRTIDRLQDRVDVGGNVSRVVEQLERVIDRLEQMGDRFDQVIIRLQKVIDRLNGDSE